MRSMKLVLSALSIFAAHHIFAAVAVAQSGVQGDACKVTATDVTVTDAAGTAVNGVLFQFTSPDGDRLDVNSKFLTIKSGKDGQTVFVDHLTTAQVVKEFNVDEHQASAGPDAEVLFKSKQIAFKIVSQ